MAVRSHWTIVRSLIVGGSDATGQVDSEVAAKQEVTWQRGVKQDGGRDAECCCSEDEKQNSINNHRHLKQRIVACVVAMCSSEITRPVINSSQFSGSSMTLRSSTRRPLLQVPRTRTAYGSRAFSVAEPTMCMLNHCLQWDKWVLNELIPLQTVV